MKECLNKYICDRCGKESLFDFNDKTDYSFVSFDLDYKSMRCGHVCTECLNDFIELAQDFFDEVNRDEQREAESKIKGGAE